MFLNTTCIGKPTVWGWKQSRSIVKQAVSLVESPKARENQFHIEVASLKDFFKSWPKIESHYCRKSTSKKYILLEWSTKKSLYNFYVPEWCLSNNIAHLSVARFNNAMETENIALFQPKKDVCEKCLSHKLGYMSDLDYNQHMQRKNEARIEKQKDKEQEEFILQLMNKQFCLRPSQMFLLCIIKRIYVFITFVYLTLQQKPDTVICGMKLRED